MSINRKGFTLIELLIVIGIIGILSSVLINTSNKNIQRGRDARRQTDLELIRSGVETYYSDCNFYPPTLQVVPGGVLKGLFAPPANCSTGNTYIKVIPSDPQFNAGAGTKYLYSSTATDYEICAYLETGTGPTQTCGGSHDCGNGKTCNYRITNP